MKKITINDLTIELTDKQIEHLKKQLDEPENINSILWKPKLGDKYWVLDTDKEIVEFMWANDASDNSQLELGNIFRTREEVEEALKTGWIAKRKAEVRILRYIAENNIKTVKGEDLNDGNVNKWDIHYDNSSMLLDCDFWYSCRNTSLPSFYAEEDAQKVMEACEADYKLIFGV